MRQIRYRWKVVGVLLIALLIPLGLYSFGRVYFKTEETPKVECSCPIPKEETPKEVQTPKEVPKKTVVTPKVKNKPTTTKESSSQVNGYTCANVRNAVSKYGKDAVTNEARSRHHLSDGRISKIYSTCGVR